MGEFSSSRKRRAVAGAEVFVPIFVLAEAEILERYCYIPPNLHRDMMNMRITRGDIRLCEGERHEQSDMEAISEERGSVPPDCVGGFP